MEDLISILTSEDAKLKVIVRAVEKGVVSDSQNVEIAIQFYEKAQWFGDAAQLAKEKEDTERADKYKTLASLLD